MTTQDLYYAAIGTRTGIADAKQWLIDNWAIGDAVRVASIRLTNAVGTVSLMEREYPGGYRAFLTATSNLRHGA